MKQKGSLEVGDKIYKINGMKKDKRTNEFYCRCEWEKRKGSEEGEYLLTSFELLSSIKDK